MEVGQEGSGPIAEAGPVEKKRRGRAAALQAAVESVKEIAYDQPLVLVKAGRGRGHPHEFDLEAIMIHVECGGSIPEVAKQIDEKHWKRVQGKILKMIGATAETQRRYEVATINRATLWADEVVQISEEDCMVEVRNGKGQSLGWRVDPGKVHQLRLRIQVRQWAVEHLLPKYSNKEEQRELGDALSTLVRGLASAARPGQTALPIAQRVDDVEDDAP
jgi:hypothetical protein